MRLETVPLLLGLFFGLIALGLIADAFIDDGSFVVTERRRRQRAERHRKGEAMVGVGLLCVAASFIGRDEWRYGTLAMMLGAALLLVGAILNWRFLRELFSHRGALRRAPVPRAEEQDGRAEPASPPGDARDKRIRLR